MNDRGEAERPVRLLVPKDMVAQCVHGKPIQRPLQYDPCAKAPVYACSRLERPAAGQVIPVSVRLGRLTRHLSLLLRRTRKTPGQYEGNRRESTSQCVKTEFLSHRQCQRS